MWQTKWGKCIHISPSGYKVYQNLLFRWLTLGSSALQTVINRRQPQKPVLHYLSMLTLMARKLPGDSCLLGLGGAGVVQILASANPDFKITAVDNNEEVIELARRFFMIDHIPELNIVLKNAKDYVGEDDIKFPHLMVDLYNANHFPAECNTEEFFSNCKKRLLEDGIFAINLANYKEQWPIFQLIKKQFKTTVVIPIRKSANMIIIASDSSNKELFIAKLRATGEIKKMMWVKTWGYVCGY